MPEETTTPPIDDAGQESTPPPATPNPRDSEISDLRRENASYRTRLRDAEKALKSAQEASQTDTEKAIAAAKAEGAAQYVERYRRAVLDNAALAVLSEKKVLATELALRGLDLSDVDVDPDTGKVDRGAIATKVDELLTRYPMLGDAAPSGPGLPVADGNSQRRVTAEQLAKASPEQVDDYFRHLLRSR